MRIDEITIRDPFVLPDRQSGRYWLFGTTDSSHSRPENPTHGFDCYSSADLTVWTGPVRAFESEPGFWGKYNFWAPEVRFINGRYFMSATFKADGVCRGTQILVSDFPQGPYRPHGAGAQTPRDWECLDGTLHIDHDGTPWMVFCHEWLQIGDGTICAVRLSDDLAAAAGEPVTLFHASDAPWTRELRPGCRVTDGPFLFTGDDGTLSMLWSSFGEHGYAMGIARSENGVTGPWHQQREPFFGRDGGHGMIFRTFDGQRRLVLHSPNVTPLERAVFLPFPAK